MTARQRSVGLALTLLGSVLAAALVADLRGLVAGPLRVPAQATQAPPSSPEPPLADAPPASPAPSPPATPPQTGTLHPVDPPTPVVSVHVRVPASVGAGQELEYQICVENSSRAPAHHVLVRNPVPANARFSRASPDPAARDPEVVWELGTLAAGACRQLTLVLLPTGPGDIKNCARVQFEHGECVTTRVAGPELAFRKVGPGRALLYDPLTYHLFVTNTGGAELTDVIVTDELPPGLEHVSAQSRLTFPVGTLAPGRSRHIEYQVIAKVSGSLTNRATVTAAGGLRREANSTVVIGEAKLSLAMTGPEEHAPNLPARYELTVSNRGTEPAANVVITDTLPAQTALVSASPGAQVTGSQVQWALGTLAPGMQRSVQLVLRATAGGVLTNHATARADRDLSAQAEARTFFKGGTGLTFSIFNSDGAVEVGRETSYVITVLNQGNIAEANLRLTATVPEQFAVTRTDPAGGRVDGARVSFEAASLAPGAAVRYVVYVKAQRAGEARFKADLTADSLAAGGPVHREESTTIFSDLPPTAPQSRAKGER